MEFGPVQMLVVGFEHGKFEGEILAELKRLRDQDIIRLVDLLFVNKDDAGVITAVELSDLSQEESMEFGALAGALVGLGAGGEGAAEEGAAAGAAAMQDGKAFSEDDVWFVADTIPPGSSAGIALIEHRWAIPLREAIERAGGQPVADEWVHPDDLVAAGAEASARS